MLVLLYDKTFDGFLSLVYEVYAHKLVPQRIESLAFLESILWSEKIEINTDIQKSGRVWNALKRRMSSNASDALFRVHLSEYKGIEMVLLRYIQKSFLSAKSIEENFGDTDVLKISRLDRKVCREAQRLAQFVRFQKTADQIFYAAVRPDFNVLPLILKHFESRYADQQWLLYDSNRRYGFFYNCREIVRVQLDSDKVNLINGKVNPEILAEEELHFQALWKQYFKSICIEERRNEKLQIQHMPKRYWQYLTEKQE
jgi:probable DNA metabolism protein